LAVGVAYGTEPGTVIKILLDAANRHESVLTDPPPAAYLKGFGESSLDFELQFWVMQDSNWMGVRSDIAMTAMKALDNAGIEIPFPQRDLHLRTIAEGAQQAPATRSSETEFPGSPQPAPVRTAERG
jgi:small-conductance mechanosensitive channel